MILDYSHAIQALYEVNDENSVLGKEVFDVNFQFIKNQQAAFTDYLMKNSQIGDNVVLLNVRLGHIIETLEKIYPKTDGKGIDVNHAIFDIDILSKSINKLLSNS